MLAFLTLSLALQAGAPPAQDPLPAKQDKALPASEDLRYEGEIHLGKIRRLTTSGENAEGYFGFGGDRIVYQATFGDMGCDQIFELDLITGARRMVSTGTGRTTCSYFLPGDEKVLFASTHAAADDCLPSPDFSQGYVWKIYPQYDLWVRDLKTWELTPLAHAPGYDAEAVVSPDGKKIVFTSRRNGDLDLYLMDIDGSNLEQLTTKKGYDGGAFFSPDSKKIVWRAYYPEGEEEIARYDALLADDSIEPMALQIYTMDLESREVVQVTDNGAANFGPYWHPDGERIIYCSNQDDPQGRDFNLYLIGADGSDNKRITYCDAFDGFPMFSRDGKRLIFASNRQGETPRNTNLFIAEWLDEAAPPPTEAEEVGMLSPQEILKIGRDGELEAKAEAIRASLESQDPVVRATAAALAYMLDDEAGWDALLAEYAVDDYVQRARGEYEIIDRAKLVEEVDRHGGDAKGSEWEMSQGLLRAFLGVRDANYWLEPASGERISVARFLRTAFLTRVMGKDAAIAAANRIDAATRAASS